MNEQEERSAHVPQRGVAKLTENFVAKLMVPNGAQDVQVFDDALPGFGVRCYPSREGRSGRKVYFVKYNVGKQQRRMKLGAASPGSLAENRRRADEVLHNEGKGCQRSQGRYARRLDSALSRRPLGRP